MKASFVSSNAISEAMRYQMMRMQADLVRSEKEVVTGRVADPGLVLGARAGQSISLSRDVNRLGTLIDSNGLVSSRLASTQASLVQLTDIANDLLPALTTAASGPDRSGHPPDAGQIRAQHDHLDPQHDAERRISVLPASTPIPSRSTISTRPGSAARAAFDTAFNTEFGFPITDDAAAGITAEQLNDFMDDLMADEFFGAGWGDQLVERGRSGDQRPHQPCPKPPRPPSAPTRTASSGWSWAAAFTSYFLEGALDDNVKKEVMQRSVGLLGEAVSELGSLQAEVGIIEQRVTSATRTRLHADRPVQAQHQRSGGRRPLRGILAHHQPADADRSLLFAYRTDPATEPCQVPRMIPAH